jgi:ribose/xylose/arabinose/galactoside ABC-type transport system permease subunit
VVKVNREFTIFLALLVLVALLPALGAYPVFVMKVMLYALFACAFNLLIGYTGLLSFGHAAFLGGAAYATGHALKEWGVPTEVGLLIGVLAGAALGLVMGLLAIRRSGIYFSMITLALAQMLYFFFLQAPFTYGEDGLQSVPRGRLLGFIDLSSDLTMYYVILGIFVVSFLLIYRTVHSPFGQVLKAIRENEARATSLGYDVARFKLLAFVLSAALAGLAGAIDRRPLEHIRTRHSDGAGRRHGNDARSDPWRRDCGCARKQGRQHRRVHRPRYRHRVVQRIGRIGDDRHRAYLRDLRDGVSARHRRRIPGVVGAPPARARHHLTTRIACLWRQASTAAK